MRIYWRPKPTIICLVLAAGMLRLGWWQWERHNEKQALIGVMEQRLETEPVPLEELLALNSATNSNWEDLDYRRVEVKGTYDFQHEVVLRNRRLDGAPGVYVLTPLRISGRPEALLVTRGFVPLSVSTPDKRIEFQRSQDAEFLGLLKLPSTRKMFAPQDPPTGPGLPKVDQWLRVDLEALQKQLPYPLLPVFAEIMSLGSTKETSNKIVRTEHGREELLFMGFKEQNVGLPDVRPDLEYPVPVYDAVIPPGRHLGYVYEWSFMAIATILIGLVIQLKPARRWKN